MPKIIYNKKLIVDAYNNREKYNLTIKQISELFCIDPKTINNYKYQTDEFLKSNSIVRCSFMHSLSDDIMKFVIKSAVNNPHFNTNTTIKNIKKQFKTVLSSTQIYTILKFNNITYKKATIKRKTKRSNQEINDMIETTINKVTDTDDIIFTDEVHIEIADINKYGWNLSGKEAIFENNTPNKILNKRITVIASVSKSKKIAYKIYDKSVNGETFRNYMRYINKKTKCKNHFLDNARIHHYKKVKLTSKRLKINTIYGVPYTPYLNIIENFFRSFKTKMRNEIMENRLNIKGFIRKCWNSVSEDVLVNTYCHVYDNQKV